jgi:hypothetical protein
MLVVEVVLLGMCCKFLCEGYKRYCESKKRQREYENAYRKINEPLGLNLGIFGETNLQSKFRALPLVRIHVQICEVAKNFLGGSIRKPVHLLKLVTAFRNLLWCLTHKRSWGLPQKAAAAGLAMQAQTPMIPLAAQRPIHRPCHAAQVGQN